MKKLLEGVGATLLIAGISTIVHECTGWFRLWGVVRYIGFLKGYEIYAGILLAVLGVAVLIASDAVKGEPEK
ncbi:hypothetical protein ACFY1P_13025 [Streptomyces sp. NPDC001407]|uniref:hypothetical protein n=1 Tax=unclassified Streptomyces TaxID=2593676 RepID=UPI0033E899E3